MKKTLLALCAVATGAAASAQAFNANDWVLNKQTFNAGWTVTYVDNAISVDLPQTSVGDLARFELSSTQDITLGGENENNTIMVLKLEWTGVDHLAFDANQPQLLRQIFIGDNNEGELQSPYFTINNDKSFGRANQPSSNAPGVTYVWRYLPGCGYQTTTPASIGTVTMWSDGFTVYGNKFVNSKFTENGENLYGRCWVGPRFVHSKNSEIEIPEGANLKIHYIGFTSAAKLGAEDQSKVTAANVKSYIEAVLSGSTSAVSAVAASELSVKGACGAVVASEAAAIEVYSLTGAKVAAAYGTEVAVPAGLYIVKATAGDAVATAKVAVK